MVKPQKELPEYINPETWQAFIDMRKSIKQPATDYAVNLLLNKLIKFKEQGYDTNEILNQSIVNNWRDLFPTKSNQSSNQGDQNW